MVTGQIPQLHKVLRQLFTVIFMLDSMSWMEKIMALNSIVSSVTQLLNAFQDLTPDEVQGVLVSSMDAMIGEEPDAILGTADKALIKVNPGILGVNGFEMLTDLIVQTSAKAIRSGMGK